MIVPTVGRMVLFRPDHYFTGAWTEGEPLPAIVCKVWNDRMVNLAVFDANGQHKNATSVTLVQEGDTKPSGRYCELMPYQKGQAAKTESLEQAIKASRETTGHAPPAPPPTTPYPTEV